MQYSGDNASESEYGTLLIADSPAHKLDKSTKEAENKTNGRYFALSSGGICPETFLRICLTAMYARIKIEDKIKNTSMSCLILELSSGQKYRNTPSKSKIRRG